MTFPCRPTNAPAVKGDRFRADQYRTVGFTLSPEMAALGVRFVAGDLSESDYIAAALDHANTLPASAPAQDYFTSLEELEAARAARDRP
jgi:hypothetical protein